MSYNLPEQVLALTKLGISVEVYSFPKYQGSKKELLEILRKESPLQPKENGFLFRENEEAHFYLMVQMPSSEKLKAVSVSGDKNKALTELVNVSDKSYAESTFIKGVGTHPVYEGCTTKSPMNSLRVISTLDNIFEMFEIGIATRSFEKEGCLHFLTVQKVYKGQLYFDTKIRKISVPTEEFIGYKNWLSLQHLVMRMIDWRKLPVSVIPEISNYPPPRGINEGRVIYFNFSTGMGMAALSGDRIGGVHWKQIEGDDQFPCVYSGQRILFSGTHTGNMIKLIGINPL